MSTFAKPKNALKRAEEAERKKREEAEWNAIAEKHRQREREVGEKERLWKEAALGRAAEPIRSSEPPAVDLPPDLGSAAPAAPAAVLRAGKYVPRWKRESGSGQAPPLQPDCQPNGTSARQEPTDR